VGRDGQHVRLIWVGLQAQFTNFGNKFPKFSTDRHHRASAFANRLRPKADFGGQEASAGQHRRPGEASAKTGDPVIHPLRNKGFFSKIEPDRGLTRIADQPQA
jgi:hypothetical protein